jgi:hypothetical protein
MGGEGAPPHPTPRAEGFPVAVMGTDEWAVWVVSLDGFGNL